MARGVTLAAIVLFALANVAGAEALTSRISVTPSPVRAGAKATIDVSIAARSGERPPASVYLKITSPRGATLRVRLTRKTSTTWRTSFVFFEKGQWQLRAVAGSGGTAKTGSLLGARPLLVRQS